MQWVTRFDTGADSGPPVIVELPEVERRGDGAFPPLWQGAGRRVRGALNRQLRPFAFRNSRIFV